MEKLVGPLMKIIGIDPGGTTGVAVVDRIQPGIVQPVDMFHWKNPKPERKTRFAEFEVQLHRWRNLFNPDVVIFEVPFMRGRAATRVLYGYCGLIESVFTPYCAVLDVEVPTLKKWATDDGKANKEDMILAARSWGARTENEHEADAFLISMYAAEKIQVQ